MGKQESNKDLTGAAQWGGCRPAVLRVTDSIPSQGMCLGYWSGPRMGVRKRQPIDVSLTHRCFSPFLSPSLPLSLKINKYNLKKKKKKKVMENEVREETGDQMVPAYLADTGGSVPDHCNKVSTSIKRVTHF